MENRPKKDGTCPIKICIIKFGEDKYIRTKFSFLPKHWDKQKREVKLHENKNLINGQLSELLKQTRLNVQEIDERFPSINIGAVKNILQNNSLNKNKHGFVAENLIDFFQAVIDETTNEDYAHHLKNTRMNLIEFRGNNIFFTDIDYKFIEAFRIWAETTPHKRGGGKKLRAKSTVRGYLIDIRMVWHKARSKSEKDKKVWFMENYPFDDIKVPKLQRTKKTTFKENAMDIFRSFTTEDPKLQLAKDTFLLQFNLLGMRIRDVITITWPEVSGGYVNYDMHKNGKIKKFILSDEAKEIINRYRGNDTKYVLPYLKMEEPIKKDIAWATIQVNKGIKKICASLDLPKITSHGSRRSFGLKMLENNVDLVKIQSFYGHSSIVTTMDYISDFDTKEADEMVLNILNKKP